MSANSESDGASPFLLARILGIVGLAGIVTGAFDIGYVQSHLVAAEDAAATLRNIAAHQALFRAGFSAHLFELVLNVPGEIIEFLLLRRVNRALAGVALCCGVLGIAIEAGDLLCAYVPLKLAIESSALSGFTAEQIHGFANLASQTAQAGLLLSWIFYGLDEILCGSLFFRSAFIPRILGAMLALSGLCYFTHGFLSFLAPAFDARLYPYIIFPCLPGEGLSSLWLAVMGLNAARWKEWTSADAKA